MLCLVFSYKFIGYISKTGILISLASGITAGMFSLMIIIYFPFDPPFIHGKVVPITDSPQVPASDDEKIKRWSEMIRVSGGQVSRRDSNNPDEVIITKVEDIYIDPIEVTVEMINEFISVSGVDIPQQWKRFSHPNYLERIGYSTTDLPTVALSYEFIDLYLDYYGLRLPTAHEWTLCAWPEDYEFDRNLVNIAGTTSSDSSPAWPVCPESMSPNSIVLTNLLGNVWEWTSDPYMNDLDYRVILGGSAFSNRFGCEKGDIYGMSIKQHYTAAFMVGFRACINANDYMDLMRDSL